MRKKIVAGNWKMNINAIETKALIDGIYQEIANDDLTNTRVIISPSYVNLSSALALTEKGIIEVAAQNMHQAKSGAFTGEVSADMLQAIGVKSVIIGHSERRAYFMESDAILAEKVNAVLANNMEAIFCFGELLEDRKSGNHFKVVAAQLSNALFHLQANDFKNIVLAYEPVWAIGTGETASPEQAQEMHEFIRKTIADRYTKDVADGISILYGGSVKPANANEIFSKEDVDGGLIGGASLKPADFAAIIKSI
ncbi:triose-phosphate isomerase [Polaribacter sp.]|uniref:triose-phosphate isomerase n=1 Tax=Polaribacter sp. TaxID=1920175 RepID=UPI003F6A104C